MGVTTEEYVRALVGEFVAGERTADDVLNSLLLLMWKIDRVNDADAFKTTTRAALTLIEHVRGDWPEDEARVLLTAFLD